jgi:hypothetical protein
MFAMLEFVMVSCLFANLVVCRGAQVVAWLKGAEATAVADVKKL